MIKARCVSKLFTKQQTIEDKQQNVGQGKLQLIKYPSEEIQLFRKNTHTHTHTHVSDLIFTLAHKCVHIKGGVYEIREHVFPWLLFSFFLSFFFFVCVIVLAAPWQPIFWAVEKIAFERTLEDTFCQLATTNFRAKRNKSLRFDCPLIYKFGNRKIQIKANNFDLAEWSFFQRSVVPQWNGGKCGRVGEWRECEAA